MIRFSWFILFTSPRRIEIGSSTTRRLARSPLSALRPAFVWGEPPRVSRIGWWISGEKTSTSKAQSLNTESGKKKGFLFLIGSVSFLLWAAAVAQNDNFNTENDDFLHQLREDVQTNPCMIIDVHRNIRDPLTLPRGVVLVNHSQGYPLLASKEENDKPSQLFSSWTSGNFGGHLRDFVGWALKTSFLSGWTPKFSFLLDFEPLKQFSKSSTQCHFSGRLIHLEIEKNFANPPYIRQSKSTRHEIYFIFENISPSLFFNFIP